MSLYKTNSAQIVGLQNSRILIQPDHALAKSSSQFVNPKYLDRSVNERVPSILKSAIRRSIKNNENQNGSAMKQSQLMLLINTKLREFIQIKNCEICEIEIPKLEQQLTLTDCEHKTNFCESCLHHYAIYKVNMYQEVLCPHEGCNALINVNGGFFKQLPADIQRNYRKIHQFFVTSKDPNKKLCPLEDCDGIIQVSVEDVMICNTCKREFCSKCFQRCHKGSCDQQEIDFFQKNLHYRQCKQCRMVIQKNQGCNHMTCRCGHQFCYVCSADWSPEHYENHDQNGQVIPAQPHVQIPQQTLFQRIRQSYLCGYIKRFIACIVFIVIFFFLFACFVVFSVILISGCIFIGLFLESFNVICDQNGFMMLLAVLLFPLCMMIGVLRALNELFCRNFKPVWSWYSYILQDIKNWLFQL